ncbi:general substrate transporter [Naematelia encephala]|uniref:General substrate transporter n=1 Tax=Naematelia encephala TaxID=71784 RepID=A0A1Y2B7F9_9TREE|nr:general substrate transporter [Naematelia encephala]
MSYRTDNASPYEVDQKPFASHMEHVDEPIKTTLDRDVQQMSAEDRATALQLAQKADPGLRLGSWRQFVFVCYVLVICMCSGDNGFDGTIMSSVNSMKQYQHYFGLASAGAKTGIVFGIYTVGQVVAFFPASYLPDRIGRRWTMLIGNVFLIAGALITALARNKGMFIGGRFLTGLGCTTANTAAKSYMAEISSPATRGRWMGLLNSFYYVGQILASGIAIPTGRMQSEWAWRTPILIQCAPAIINITCVMLLPESPRWLYSRGHTEKAVQILARLHSRDNDINSPLIKLEIQEIEVNIDMAGADKRFWDFRALFRTSASRYRFMLCAVVSCWGQLSGNGLITYFLPVLLQQAGIVSPDRQRVLNFVNSVTSFIGALSGTAIIDHVGRRKLMIFSTISCMLGMAIVSGLLSPSGEQNSMRANAGISFIFLFMVFFSFGWTPLQALYPAEVLSFENRAKGLALQGWVTNAVSCINTFGLPPALAAIGWKTYLIFFAWDIVGIIVVWLFVVETKQLSLEDMDEIFDSKNPKRTSFELARAARERAKHEREMLAAINQ